MKSLSYFALASFFFLSSCSKNNDSLESEDFSAYKFPQTWKLVKMTGNFEGSVSIGQEMVWQENYVFKSDGSFNKTRITERESESASGRYIFDEINNNFLLNYEQYFEIIANCSSNTKEYLYFNEDSNLLLSNWWACDGPGLFYERIK